MRIEKALAVPARGGFFNDDLAVIRAGAKRDGFTYDGSPRTPGFSMIRQPSEAASIILLLDNGQSVAGDALSVQYSGTGGRQGPFRHAQQLPLLASVCQWLEGQTIDDFMGMCERLEKQAFPEGLNRTAAAYAVSQALLQAVAFNEKKTPAEVLAGVLGVQVSETPIAINVQCGDDLRNNVDKAVLKRADVLPHGLINSIDTKLGKRGEILAEYVTWIVERIRKFGGGDYNPELHIDVYGLIGDIFEQDVERIADYIADLGKRSWPHDFCLETPVLMDSRQGQIDKFAAIRRALAKRDSKVKIIVDEWANDLDDIRAFVRSGATDMINVKSPDLGAVGNAGRAVLECWAGGVRPILGGSCVDTDQSARIMAHVALATKPAWVLARPGMGIDEGLQIVANEMTRTLAIIGARKG